MCLSTIYSECSYPYDLTCIGILQIHSCIGLKYRVIQNFSPPGGTSVPSTLYNKGSYFYELTWVGIFQNYPTVSKLEQFKIFHHQEALV